MANTDPHSDAPAADAPVFYRGLDAEAVTRRHLRYAEALTADDIEFELLTTERRTAVTALLNASLAEAREDRDAVAADSVTAGREDGPPGPPASVAAAGSRLHLLPQDTGIVATAGDAVLAAAVVTTVTFTAQAEEPGAGESRTGLFLRGIGTHTPHRGRGLATVLLGLLPQVLQQAGMPTRAQVITQIPESRATFFHRAGYMVELPGAQVPKPVAETAQRLLPEFGPGTRWAHQSLA